MQFLLFAVRVSAELVLDRQRFAKWVHRLFIVSLACIYGGSSILLGLYLHRFKNVEFSRFLLIFYWRLEQFRLTLHLEAAHLLAKVVILLDCTLIFCLVYQQLKLRLVRACHRLISRPIAREHRLLRVQTVRLCTEVLLWGQSSLLLENTLHIVPWDHALPLLHLGLRADVVIDLASHTVATSIGAPNLVLESW